MAHKVIDQLFFVGYRALNPTDVDERVEHLVLVLLPLGEVALDAGGAR